MATSSSFLVRISVSIEDLIVESIWLSPAEWCAILRIGLGLWWLESFRHKDKRAWIERNAGIEWAASVAANHPSRIVSRGFQAILSARPREMGIAVLVSELALGLGLVLGLMSPVALACSLLLNCAYFILMIEDWAEQGQNLMMMLVALVGLGTKSWQVWSLDAVLGWF